MRLRIRHREGIATLTTLTEQSTLLDLHNEIAKEIQMRADRLEVKTGYPPKLLVIDDTTAQSSLASLGITNGEQILTSERPEGSTPTFNFAPHQPTPQTPTTSVSTHIPPPSHTLNNTARISAFAATTKTGEFGFASSGKAAQFTIQSRSPIGSAATSGSPIPPIPDHSIQPAPVEVIPSSATPSDNVVAIRVRDEGFLVLREVADDNSCLFNAIAYTIDPSMKGNIKALRQIVADAIEANPEAYSDVVLGRPRSEYCDWIKRENSWGGAIELTIFSDHYGIEIDSIDVSTNRVDRFGEGQYSQRVLLMYSGIHYDALALTPALDIPPECDQTQFDTSAEAIITTGIQLAARLKKEHKYTDLATFTLRCSICQAGLKGQKDAQEHARQTMHEQL
ncbi:ubiquitin-specific protease otu1 [Mortierella sp. GBA43]|nr:ubiquitin-specific protease otu1 [Mortierella sp. GBA43]